MKPISRQMPKVLSSLYLTCVLLAGCASPVAESDAIFLKLSGIKEGDVDNGQIVEDKNINSAEGNPYAEFLRTAQAALDGANPSTIEVSHVTLHVHSDSKGITGFETVFESLDVIVSSSDSTFFLARVDEPTGTTVPMGSISNEVGASIQSALLAGDFKLGVWGRASDTLPEDFDLKISFEVGFSAFP